eukprot:1037009-Amphidinium_carterae.1
MKQVWQKLPPCHNLFLRSIAAAPAEERMLRGITKSSLERRLVEPTERHCDKVVDFCFQSVERLQAQLCHHATTRQDTFRVTKLKSNWHIASAAPVCVDGWTSTREFNMSYTVDTDPQSIGMDWWGTTYVKIDANSAAAPAAPANNAVVPSGD